MEANTPTTSLIPRTAREWFEMFPEPYRSNAIRDLEPSKQRVIYNTPADALLDACTWGFATPPFSPFHEDLILNKIQLTEPKKGVAEQPEKEADAVQVITKMLTESDRQNKLLDIRAYFAGFAMQVTPLPTKDGVLDYSEYASKCVKLADALIAELKKEQNETETN